jgi:hypothetical protein
MGHVPNDKQVKPTKPSKIIQITGSENTVYALDEDGNVWFSVFRHNNAGSSAAGYALGGQTKNGYSKWYSIPVEE